MIYGRQSCDTRKMEEDASIDVGNAKFGGQEALVVLDHVFIPNEYIFLNGEYEFAGMIGGALRRLSPPVLRRLQGGRGRHPDRRRRSGR